MCLKMGTLHAAVGATGDLEVVHSGVGLGSGPAPQVLAVCLRRQVPPAEGGCCLEPRVGWSIGRPPCWPCSPSASWCAWHGHCGPLTLRRLLFLLPGAGLGAYSLGPSTGPWGRSQHPGPPPPAATGLRLYWWRSLSPEGLLLKGQRGLLFPSPRSRASLPTAWCQGLLPSPRGRKA